MLRSCVSTAARSSCSFVERSRPSAPRQMGPFRFARTYIRCQGRHGSRHRSVLPEHEHVKDADCANCCAGAITPCTKPTTTSSHEVARSAASAAPSCSLDAAGVCLTVTAAASGTLSTRPAANPAPAATTAAAAADTGAVPFTTTELSPLTRAFVKASILRMLLLHTMWAAQYLLPAGVAGGALAPVALASGYLLLQQTGFWLKMSTDMSQAQDLMSSAWQQQVTANSTLSDAGMHEWAVQLSALSAVTDPEMFFLLLRVPAFSALASVCMAAWAAAGAALSPAGYKPSCKDLAALGQQVFLLTAMANAMQQARGSLVEQLFRWEHMPMPGEGLGMAAAATAAAGAGAAAGVDSEAVTEVSRMVTGREDALWDMIRSWCLAIQSASGGCSCPGGACPSACVDYLEQHWGARVAELMGSHPATQPLHAKGSAMLGLLLWDLVPARARARALRR